MRLKKSEIERAALANRFTISASGAAVARATGLTGAEKARASRQERATREFCTAEHLAHAMGGTVRRAHEASETRYTLSAPHVDLLQIITGLLQRSVTT